MKNTNLLSRFGLLAIALVAFTNTGFAQDSYETAYAEANNLILDENWSAAVDALDSFLKDNPSGRRSDDANFYRCYAAEKSGVDQKEVFECFNTFVQLYGTSSYADD